MTASLKLMRFLRPYWRWVLVAPLLMSLEVAMDLLQPRMVERIIDEGIARLDQNVVSTRALDGRHRRDRRHGRDEQRLLRRADCAGLRR